MLAEGGPLEVPEVVDNEEALAEGGDQSSGDDDDSEDADVTRTTMPTKSFLPRRPFGGSETVCPDGHASREEAR